MSDGRRLLVMRHAKAEPFGPSDHERALTERGHASARDLGRHLHAQGLRPDFVVVSTAVRTRQTWSAVAEALEAPDEIEVGFEDALFTGSADLVVGSVKRAPEQARTVLFVGHNPTAEYLCHYLDDGGGDVSAVSGLLQGFPPGAVALLEVGVAWADLDAETGRIAGFYVGRG